MEVEYNERAILTGFDRNVDKGRLSKSSHDVTDFSKTTDNTDENLNRKEDSIARESKTPRKYHAKSKRKPEVTSSTSQSEIENMQIYRTDQLEDKDVFLPRLTSSSSRVSPDCKSQDSNGEQQLLRLPEIRIVPSNYSRMALNRSITDLLDPEMEILNKIKHGPRKKKKKRHNKTVRKDSEQADGT
ncbi:uncharacterized protein LOC123528259 [Mercenaria mercenaria]|uniref:uncharacterized protein LOC123528259 n=1 Tax=Mercenaria mercenaria TaxID=6596 RepID=UPI001E1D8391|nr:uncharacterized protein LOC123528259 [Mercenaria mercenaria]XP_045163930.1 uncharacterized protein LOC123528259 [Mercenaria mercenaria]